MPRMPRAVIPGYPHHVTQRGVRSLPIFRNDEDRQYYIRYIREETKRFELDVLAWCLMTNHVHFVVLPHRPDSLSRGIGEAHRRYTRRVNLSEDVRGHLFQERFHSCAMDERHLIAAARYVELNPVKANLCPKPENWPWSSARFHLGIEPNDPLVKDRSLLGLVPPSKWEEFLNTDTEVKDSNLLRLVKTGRPAGDAAFVQKLETIIGRTLTMAPRGRPRLKTGVLGVN